MMLLEHFDEIESASDAELVRIYRLAILRNRNGRHDDRLRRIIAEIQKRNAGRGLSDDVFVHIAAQTLPTGDE